MKFGGSTLPTTTELERKSYPAVRFQKPQASTGSLAGMAMAVVHSWETKGSTQTSGDMLLPRSFLGVFRHESHYKCRSHFPRISGKHITRLYTSILWSCAHVSMAFISGLCTESCAFLSLFTSHSNPLHGCTPHWKAKEMSMERLTLRKLRHESIMEL